MFSDYIYDNKADKHSFVITDIDLAIINSIRRILLSEIPVVGFYGEDKDEKEKRKTLGVFHLHFSYSDLWAKLNSLASPRRTPLNPEPSQRFVL